MAQTLTGAKIADTYKTLMKAGSNNPVALASGSGSSERLVFGEDDAADVRTALYVTQDRLGLGTATPDTELHLETAVTGATVGPMIRIERNDTGIAAGEIYGGIEWEGQDGTGSAAGVRAQLLGVADDTAGGTSIRFKTTGGGSTALKDRVTITSDGDVGIGQTNTAPPTNLHIMNTATGTPVGTLAELVVQHGTDGGSAQAGISLISDDGGLGFVNFGDMSDEDTLVDENVGYITYTHSSNEMKFGTNAAKQMFIEDDGKIGIGRTNACNLDGKGIHISGTGGNHTSDQEFFVVQAESHDTSNRGATKIGTGITDGDQSGHGHANLWMYNDGGAVYTRLSGSNTPGSTSIDEYSYMTAGLAIGIDRLDNLIHTSTHGTGTDVLWIGDDYINVTSDERIKKNIINTEMNATETLGNLRVVDFNWNHPEEKESINVTLNAKGTFTGLIAQEMIEHVPFAVNVPKKESYAESLISGKPMENDLESEGIWTVHYEVLVPVLIKSIQELTARIATLENA